jgi:predicted transcriptional regulator
LKGNTFVLLLLQSLNMTSPTTLKLPDELKARIAAAAEEAGKTPHAFMVEALAAQTALAERRREFVAAAAEAEQEIGQYGLVYDADEVFSYVREKLAGKRAKRPKPRKR